MILIVRLVSEYFGFLFLYLFTIQFSKGYIPKRSINLKVLFMILLIKVISLYQLPYFLNFVNPIIGYTLMTSLYVLLIYKNINETVYWILGFQIVVNILIYLPTHLILVFLKTEESLYFNIFGTINVILACLIITICNQKFAKTFLDKLRYYYKKICILFFIVYILVYCFFVSYSLKIGIKSPTLAFERQLYYLVFIIVIILLLFLAFELYKKNNQIIEQKALIEDYASSVENLFDEIRSYKHDISNILLSLRYVVDNGTIEEIQEYFNNKVDYSSKLLMDEYKIISQISMIDNKSLKGMLVSKYKNALENGITLNIMAGSSILSTNVNDTDLCRIIGILLDNAIEGTIMCDNKIIELEIFSTYEISKVIISNTYNPKYLYDDFSTTKGPSRGIGLKSLRFIIKKYSSLELSTTIHSNRFVQTIVFNKEI